MKQIPSKKELAEFIKQKITYFRLPATYCPHCNKEISPPTYCIDFTSVLAEEINHFLGFKKRQWYNRETPEGMIFSVIANYKYVTGNKDEDANALAYDIWHLFWEDEEEENNKKEKK